MEVKLSIQNFIYIFLRPVGAATFRSDLYGFLGISSRWASTSPDVATDANEPAQSILTTMPDSLSSHFEDQIKWVNDLSLRTQINPYNE